MKNLKKVLSLVLALAMAMSLMTAAFAKGAGDYADADEITNTEAVSILSALNVINGKGDGTNFDPTGNVTRAEMAKMITVISLGDVDVSAFKGTTTDLKDINNWAEAYIKYCYSQGIIAGRGNGIFAPVDNVTAAEAAKMLLVAIGYNAEVQGYTGASWKINVVRDAQLTGLFVDLSVTADQALTRDEAAQMIWNAVQADTITKSSSVDRVTGNITDIYNANGDSLLEKTFGALSQKAYLYHTSYNKTDADYDYTFVTGTTMGQAAITTDALKVTALSSETDYSDLFGQKVTVVYKNDAKAGYPVYGIYSEATEVYAGVLGDVTTPAEADTKIEVNKVKYEVTSAADVEVYGFNDTSWKGNLTSVAAGNAYEEFVAYDNTGDGKADIVIWHPVSIAQVSYVGNTSFTADGSVKFEDVSVYDGIAKDDYVVITAAANTANNTKVYEKLDTVSGKVAATKGTADVQIDGTWLTNVSGTTMVLDSEYDYVVLNGYVVAAVATSTTVSVDDYVVITAIQTNADWDATNKKANIMTSDGTIKTVEVKQDAGSAALAAGLHKVVKVEDGVYTLTSVLGVLDDTSVVTSGADAYVKKDGKIGGIAIADDAVIYVKNTADTPATYKVITGAELKKLDDISASNVWHALSKANSTTGYSSVVFAFVGTGMSTSSDMAYGYVISDAVSTKDGTKTLVNFTVWDGAKEVPLTTDGTVSTTNLAKGAIVAYKLTDGKVSTLNTNTDTDAAIHAAAIHAYDGKNISFTAALDDKMVITDDTAIIYVDVANKAAAEGGTIELAHKQQNGSYVNNVAYSAKTTTNSDGKYEVQLLVVDVNGHIDGTTELN